MSEKELRYDINLGNKSGFQREKFAYIKTRLELIDNSEKSNIVEMKKAA